MKQVDIPTGSSRVRTASLQTLCLVTVLERGDWIGPKRGLGRALGSGGAFGRGGERRQADPRPTGEVASVVGITVVVVVVVMVEVVGIKGFTLLFLLLLPTPKAALDDERDSPPRAWGRLLCSIETRCCWRAS